MSADEFVALGVDPFEQFVRQVIVNLYGEKKVGFWELLIPLFTELFSAWIESCEEQNTPEVVLARFQAPPWRLRRRAVNQIFREARGEGKRITREAAREQVEAIIKTANDKPEETLEAIRYEMGV
jgi:hypothetical protein